MSDYKNIHVQQPDNELRELRRWKAEAMQALNAIYKKSEEIGGRLGESTIDRVLNRLDYLEKENAELRRQLDKEYKGYRFAPDKIKLPCPKCNNGSMGEHFTTLSGAVNFICNLCGYEALVKKQL